jgi:hypothetical protein
MNKNNQGGSGMDRGAGRTGRDPNQQQDRSTKLEQQRQNQGAQQGDANKGRGGQGSQANRADQSRDTGNKDR